MGRLLAWRWSHYHPVPNGHLDGRWPDIPQIPGTAGPPLDGRTLDDSFLSQAKVRGHQMSVVPQAQRLGGALGTKRAVLSGQQERVPCECVSVRCARPYPCTWVKQPWGVPAGSDQWAATGPGARTIAQVCTSKQPPGRKPVGAGLAGPRPRGPGALLRTLAPARPQAKPEAILGACVEAPGGPYKALSSSMVPSGPKVHPATTLQLYLRAAGAPLPSAHPTPLLLP